MEHPDSVEGDADYDRWCAGITLETLDNLVTLVHNRQRQLGLMNQDMAKELGISRSTLDRLYRRQYVSMGVVIELLQWLMAEE